VEEEVAAFQRALGRSKEQIRSIRDSVADSTAEHHQILSVHLALLEDSTLMEQTVRMIRENQFTADWAFNRVLQSLLETFTGSRTRISGSGGTTCADRTPGPGEPCRPPLDSVASIKDR